MKRTIFFVALLVIAYWFGWQDGEQAENPNTCVPPIPVLIIGALVNVILWFKNRIQRMQKNRGV
jgi:hypothetical protein